MNHYCVHIDRCMTVSSDISSATAAKLLQSCLTLCDPTDGSPPGSPVPGILQARRCSGLPFPSPMHESEKWKGSRSVMYDLATPWTTAYQAPPSMGFSRQEYWSGVPLPSPKVSLPTLKYVISICICTGGQVHSSQEYRILNHDYIWINIK